MKVAVTGASGHVGAALVRKLLTGGHDVRALIRSDRKALEDCDVDVVKADILNVPELESAFAGVELVFHLAARIRIGVSAKARLGDVNTRGVLNVIHACRICGVRRLVHFSSIHALSPRPRSGIVDETRRLVSAGEGMEYDQSKAEAERIVLKAAAAGFDAVIVNPSGIIGPFDFKPSLMGRFLISLFCGKIPALVEGGFNWVDVRDAAAGAIAAADRGRSGERYLLAGHWHSVREIAALVSGESKRGVPRLVAPMFLAEMAGPFTERLAGLVGKEPLFTSDALYSLKNHRRVSHLKAAEQLNYRPRPIANTVRDTCRWFLANGYLGACQKRRCVLLYKR